MTDLNQIFEPLNYSTLYSSNLSFNSIVASDNGQYVFAAAYNDFIYISSNYGVNWTQIPGTSGNWYELSCDPSGVYVVAVQSPGYIYYSTNSGVNWTKSGSFTSSSNWQSVSKKINNGYVFACQYPGTIYYSSNHGQTWTASTGLPSNAYLFSVTSTNTGEYVVTSGYTGTSSYFIYASSNSGAKFTNTNYALGAYVYFNQDGTKCFASVRNAGIYISTDFGNNWLQTIAPALNWDRICCNNSGSAVVAGYQTGIYTSSDGGNHWYQQVFVPTQSQSYSFAFDAIGQQLFFTSRSIFKMQINALTNFLSNGVDLNQMFNTGNSNFSTYMFVNNTNLSNLFSPLVWTKSTYATGKNLVNITSNNTGQYLATVSNFDNLYTSTDFGNTWTARSSGSLNWNIVSIDDTGEIIFAAVRSGRIYYSNNNGLTLTASSSPSASLAWQEITRKTYSGNIAYAVVDNTDASGNIGIWKTTNTGQTWTNIFNVNAFWISITMSSNGIIVYAAQQNGYIFKSINSGTNWTQLSAPSAKWNSVHCDQTGQYVVACIIDPSGGIYVSNDSGNTWTLTSAPLIGWTNVMNNTNDGSFIAATTLNNQIYTSTNFGSNWNLQTYTATTNWFSVTCSSNGQYISAVAKGDGIYKTQTVPKTNFLTPLPYVVVGGSISEVNGYNLATFNLVGSNNSLVFNTSASNVSIICVGGGEAGGSSSYNGVSYNYGQGGGGGASYQLNSQNFNNGTILKITVGVGGSLSAGGASFVQVNNSSTYLIECAGGGSHLGGYVYLNGVKQNTSINGGNGGASGSTNYGPGTNSYSYSNPFSVPSGLSSIIANKFGGGGGGGGSYGGSKGLNGAGGTGSNQSSQLGQNATTYGSGGGGSGAVSGTLSAYGGNGYQGIVYVYWQ
jgi:hypothetical protein